MAGLRGIDDGFYVDIGAADPSVGSVSRIFYDHGWSGINVEPSPTFDALSAERERDVNLRIAVGESEGSSPFFRDLSRSRSFDWGSIVPCARVRDDRAHRRDHCSETSPRINSS